MPELFEMLKIWQETYLFHYFRSLYYTKIHHAQRFRIDPVSRTKTKSLKGQYGINFAQASTGGVM